jgi:hypothetical protein
MIEDTNGTRRYFQSHSGISNPHALRDAWNKCNDCNYMLHLLLLVKYDDYYTCVRMLISLLHELLLYTQKIDRDTLNGYLMLDNYLTDKYSTNNYTDGNGRDNVTSLWETLPVYVQQAITDIEFFTNTKTTNYSIGHEKRLGLLKNAYEEYKKATVGITQSDSIWKLVVNVHVLFKTLESVSLNGLESDRNGIYMPIMQTLLFFTDMVNEAYAMSIPKNSNAMDFISGAACDIIRRHIPFSVLPSNTAEYILGTHVDLLRLIR